MGVLSARFRRKQDPIVEEPEPSPEPIKRYRVQSVPALSNTRMSSSRTVYSHRDDFTLVTKAWKREPDIRILEPSEDSVRSSQTSTWSSPSLETQVSFKHGPSYKVHPGAVSPTFSMCGSLSPSPSLDYSGSVSSNSSRCSASSWGSKSSLDAVNAGVPPLLPAHRTFSGSPHHGSFCHRPSRHNRNTSIASDYIPIHVFTRECKAPIPPKHDLEIARVRERERADFKRGHAKRFSLDGYNGDLRVVNTTPPSSPREFDLGDMIPTPRAVSTDSAVTLVQAQAPVRYRIPSKASMMDV